MKEVITGLETIASTVERNSDVLKVEQAIKAIRDLIKNHELPLLKELDTELATWQSKLSVILKEPVGKKGMAKHARFWAERIESLRGA